jgi:hypothetical protein
MRWWPRSTGPGSNWMKTYPRGLFRWPPVAGRQRMAETQSVAQLRGLTVCGPDDCATVSRPPRRSIVCSHVGSNSIGRNSAIISMPGRGIEILIRPVINPSVEPGPDPLAPPLQIDFIGVISDILFPAHNRIHSSIVSKFRASFIALSRDGALPFFVCVLAGHERSARQGTIFAGASALAGFPWPRT